jgi:flagellar protein FlbD
MIAVTRLDGSTLVVNAELIERIEATPDTIVTMSNHDTFVVRETPEALVERVLAYKRALPGGVEPSSGTGVAR